VEGTPVLTADGLVPIESIRTGDKVYTLDLNRGEPVINRVLKTFTSRRDEIIELDFGKETISSTPQHRFYTGEWIAAQELRVGNALLNRQGQHIELKRIQRKKSASQSVFNLGVEGIPNYFVGELKLLVHNDKPDRPTAP
jgi:Pretoxin HINT domain